MAKELTEVKQKQPKHKINSQFRPSIAQWNDFDKSFQWNCTTNSKCAQRKRVDKTTLLSAPDFVWINRLDWVDTAREREAFILRRCHFSLMKMRWNDTLHSLQGKFLFSKVNFIAHRIPNISMVSEPRRDNTRFHFQNFRHHYFAGFCRFLTLRQITFANDIMPKHNIHCVFCRHTKNVLKIFNESRTNNSKLHALKWLIEILPLAILPSVFFFHLIRLMSSQKHFHGNNISYYFYHILWNMFSSLMVFSLMIFDDNDLYFFSFIWRWNYTRNTSPALLFIAQ